MFRVSDDAYANLQSNDILSDIFGPSSPSETSILADAPPRLHSRFSSTATHPRPMHGTPILLRLRRIPPTISTNSNLRFPLLSAEEVSDDDACSATSLQQLLDASLPQLSDDSTLSFENPSKPLAPSSHRPSLLSDPAAPAPEASLDSRIEPVGKGKKASAARSKGAILLDEDDSSGAFHCPPRSSPVPLCSTSKVRLEQPSTRLADRTNTNCQDEPRAAASDGVTFHAFHKASSPSLSTWSNCRNTTSNSQKDPQSTFNETASETDGELREQTLPNLAKTSSFAKQECTDPADFKNVSLNLTDLKSCDAENYGCQKAHRIPGLALTSSQELKGPCAKLEGSLRKGDHRKLTGQGGTKTYYIESVAQDQSTNNTALRSTSSSKLPISNLPNGSRHNHGQEVNARSTAHPFRRKRNVTPPQKFSDIQKCSSVTRACFKNSPQDDVQSVRTSTRQHGDSRIKHSVLERGKAAEPQHDVSNTNIYHNRYKDVTQPVPRYALIDEDLLRPACAIILEGGHTNDFSVPHSDAKPCRANGGATSSDIGKNIANLTNSCQNLMNDKETPGKRAEVDNTSNQSPHCLNFQTPIVKDALNEDSHMLSCEEPSSKTCQETSTGSGVCSSGKGTHHFHGRPEYSSKGGIFSCLRRDVAINTVLKRPHETRDSSHDAEVVNAISIVDQRGGVLRKTADAFVPGKRNDCVDGPNPKRPKFENGVERPLSLPQMTATTDGETMSRDQSRSTVAAILESAIEAAVAGEVELTGLVTKAALGSLKTRLPPTVLEHSISQTLKRTSKPKRGKLNELLGTTGSSEKRFYQTRVFTWDCERRVKSSDSYFVHDISRRVMEDNSRKLFVYDGQDFYFNELSPPPVLRTSKYEQLKWESSVGCRKSLRVRMWDTILCSVLPYERCPTISSLASFLRDHPQLRVFHPAYAQEVLTENQPETVPVQNKLETQKQLFGESGVESGDRKSALDALKGVLSRIRWNCTTDLQETRLKNILLWNCATEKVEVPMDFPRRAALTVFLLRNPHLQLLQYQEKLQMFEKSTAFHFIPVYLHCPVELAFLWDMIRQKRNFRPSASSFQPSSTLGDIIGPFSSTTIYVGQDLVEAPFLREVLRLKSIRGCMPWRHMLANCGMRIQREIYDKGWVPHYIDSKLWPCSKAVYWDTDTKRVREGCKGQKCHSVHDHIELGCGITQLYLGQNLAFETQDDLKGWFGVLHFRPGFASSNSTAILLRPWMIVGTESGFVEQLKFESEKRQRESKHEIEARQRKKQRVIPGVANRTNAGSVEVLEVSDLSVKQTEEENKFLNPSRPLHAPVQPIPLDQSSGPFFKPRTRAGAGRPQISSSVVLEDELDGVGMDISNKNETLPKVSRSKLLEQAHRKVARLLGSIREAGQKVFRGELTRDLRQELREELINRVESVQGLEMFLAQVEKIDFPCMAWELCERIEAMDVWHLFRSSYEASLGPPSLTALSRDILKGRICLATEVFSRFRQMCHQYIIYYGESMVGNAALEMLKFGHELFHAFSMKYRHPLDLEAKMIKVGEICEAACKIGFLKPVGKGKARSMGSLNTALKVSIRVAGSEPMVTFMNYRDEKGHAVMGKQQSVRILGLSIDVRECEKRIGQLRKCHVCNDEVREGAGGFLKCSNWIFDFCHEVVCRACVEQVLSIDFTEYCRLRERERWFCPHCQGICSSDSRCHLSKKDVKRKNNSLRVVRLWWRNLNWDARLVRMNVMRRSLNGEFDQCDSRVIELFQNREDSSLWERTVKLPTGAYRCGVFLDDIEVASTCFQVYHDETMCADDGKGLVYVDDERRFETPKDAGANSRLSEGEALGEDYIKRQPKCTRQRIRWEMSPNVFIHGAKVKSWQSRAMCDQGEGSGIENCSRTEGYDWRRAKYHPVQMWIPHVFEDRNKNGANVGRDVMYCTNEWMWRDWYQRDQPEVPIGMTHRESTVTWNTYMYSKMVKKLWGIVAGRSEIHGIGLFTLTGYERGEMVIEYAGDLIRTPLGDVREGEYQNAGLGTYLFKLNDDQIVDATVHSNRARFTNHSCDPNMMADVITIAGRELVVLRATRRISKYAELTFDYQLPYEEDEKLNCLCNSSNCVGVMN